jgi:hypothetical protein
MRTAKPIRSRRDPRFGLAQISCRTSCVSPGRGQIPAWQYPPGLALQARVHARICSFSRLGRRVSMVRAAVLPTTNGTDAV